MMSETMMLEDRDPEFPYLPPCMKCQPIIDYVSVNYHDDSISSPLKLFEDPEWKFGTCDLAIRAEIPIISKHLHVLFTIDASGSMSDKCADNRSKMEHILYTLENILRIFHEKKECNISVHIQSFDSKIKTIYESDSLIKEQLIEDIIRTIQEIRTGDATNIELALETAKEKITSYKEAHLDHEIIHIFLTDGEITSGSKDKEVLKSLVSIDCANVFIGYGLNHDSSLLSELGEGIKNEYRFIDALEKAGLVYGEIVHGILYKAIEDVCIKTQNCEIYDYKTNTWQTELKICNLLSEQKKTYHLRSNVLDFKRSVVVIYGKTIVKTRQYQVLTNDIEYQTSSNSVFEANLIKYMFRQRTQELLYKSKFMSSARKITNFIDLHLEMGVIDKNVEKKAQLRSFLKLMKDYMKENNMESDLIMKMLCDDIYITYKTFGTSVGSMYTNARQSSQGREHTYTVNVSQDIEDFMPPQPPRLGLGFGFGLGFRQQNNLPVTDDDDLNYALKQTYISPYSTTGMIRTMREVSGDHSLKTQETDSIN